MFKNIIILKGKQMFFIYILNNYHNPVLFSQNLFVHLKLKIKANSKLNCLYLNTCFEPYQRKNSM